MDYVHIQYEDQQSCPYMHEIKLVNAWEERIMLNQVDSVIAYIYCKDGLLLLMREKGNDSDGPTFRVVMNQVIECDPTKRD